MSSMGYRSGKRLGDFPVYADLDLFVSKGKSSFEFKLESKFEFKLKFRFEFEFELFNLERVLNAFDKSGFGLSGFCLGR
jgi:hypothetical protein